MITKRQYQEAKDLIVKYRVEQSKEAVKNLRCICCDKPITPLEGMLPALTELTSGAWENGTVAMVDFGYGSPMHDGDAYFVGLCDNCMQEAINKEIVIKHPRVL